MMIFRAWYFSLFAVLLVVQPVGQAHADDVIRWRLGSPVSPGDSFERVLEEYARRVEERSEGRLQIEVLSIAPLGFKPADSLRILRQDVLEAMFISPHYAARDEPRLAALMPQGALLEIRDNLRIADVQTQIAREILADWSLDVITRLTDTRSASFVIASKRPIRSLDELRRVKLRHFTKLGIEAFNALGVSTQYISSADLFLALKMGIVDATAYSPAYILSQSIYEVTCCYSEVGYYTFATPSVVATRSDRWMKVPADLREVMKEVGREMFSADLELAMERAREKPIIALLKDKGMQVLPPFSREDRLAIQNALFEAWERQCNNLGGDAIANRARVLEALGGKN